MTHDDVEPQGGGSARPESLEGEEDVGDGAEGVETPLVDCARVGGAEVRDDPTTR